MRTYIRSMNGVRIDFLEITPQMIKIEAILLHLAKTCRYHGMVNGWYSNAEHSYLGSYRASDRLIEKAFLVHDFGEHITADVAGPIKSCCLDYTQLCDTIQKRMNLHFLGYEKLPAEVKAIDLRITATEQKVLREAPVEDYEPDEPYDDMVFRRWEWRTAYKQLKTRFYTLFPDYRDAV